MYSSESSKTFIFLSIVILCLFFPEVVGAIVGFIAACVFAVFAAMAVCAFINVMFFSGTDFTVDGVRYKW